jgi:hypothetical protein
VNWWTFWDKALRSMQPQHPGRKQLRKESILQTVTSPEGAVLKRHPTRIRFGKQTNLWLENTRREKHDRANLCGTLRRNE